MKTIKSIILIFAIFLCMSFLYSCGSKEVVGPQGPQGEPGKDGISLLTGNGIPSNNLGKNGDSYIDLDSWNYYIKTNNEWVNNGSIKGGDENDDSNEYVGSEGLEFYPINESECAVSIGNARLLSEIVIPSKYKNFTVTTLISDDTTNGVLDSSVKYPNLTQIQLPNSLTNIESFALSGCKSLTKIVIPNGVVSIGANAFRNCTNLEQVIFEKDSNLESIEYQAFSYCSSLASITIPNSVTSIGSYAFEDCSSLESITIPNSVTSIGHSAFYNCSSLECIVIPDSVTSISSSTFYNCSSLENVYFEGTIEDWCNFKFSDYDSNPMEYAKHLYLKDSNNEYYEITSLTEIEIPNTVTSICAGAFSEFTNLECIVIPNSVTNIGLDAFGGCVKLENVYYSGTLHDWCMLNQSNLMFNVEKLYMKDSNNEYFDITSMTELVIPNTVTSICAFAFSEFINLESIVIPNSVTNIDSFAFNGCRSLTNIKIPDTVTSIGDYTFCNCTSLESIVIPSGVVSIGACVFYGCRGVTIYCELSSQPDDWHSIWYSIDNSSRPVSVYWNESWEYDNEGNPIPLD